jgi:hypothetical protein
MVLNLDFSGNLPMYLLGLPFAIVLAINIKDNRKRDLMMNLTKFDKGE